MIQDHLNKVLEATSIEEVWALHTRKMAEFGFTRLLYGYTRFGNGQSFGDLQDALILTNHDPGYIERFQSEGHYFNAPMIRWALNNTGACSWRWLADSMKEGSLSAREQEVVRFNTLHGVIAGYSISFNEMSSRARGAIGMTVDPCVSQDQVDALWQIEGPEIEIINKVTHLKITHLPYTGQRRALTSRQREVLQWISEGKTVLDTATIMGLTVATIEKHLRLARQALDVDTTAQAVLKASVQNQFYLLEL